MLQLDFLEPSVERFLADLCWSLGGDGDCLRDCGAEKEVSFLRLCRPMGKRVGQLKLLYKLRHCVLVGI
jgi:hypothetical protein